jgi:uncharacterized protein (DUF1330 family)
MSTEGLNPNEETLVSESPEKVKIDVAKYGGRVVEKDGVFETSEGAALLERDGELFVLEGDDVGTRIMREDEPTIPSGY